MKIQLFNIANFKVDGGAMFGVIPKALWSRVYQSDSNNLINLSLRSMIIEIDRHIILVDAGWGDKQDEKFFRHVHLNGGEGLIEGLEKKRIQTGRYYRCFSDASSCRSLRRRCKEWNQNTVNMS